MNTHWVEPHHGAVTDLNIWDRILSEEEESDWVFCKTETGGGNVISWQSAHLNTNTNRRHSGKIFQIINCLAVYIYICYAYVIQYCYSLLILVCFDEKYAILILQYSLNSFKICCNYCKLLMKNKYY